MPESKLLLIGHDRDRLLSFQKNLEPLGCQALIAEVASVAAELCDGAEICAVVMDLDPNAAEAIEMAKRIRDEAGSRHAPILYLNGDADVPEALKRRLEAHVFPAAPVRPAAQLERTVVELTRANEALHDFTWAASHDLKEPLRGIVVLADRLIRSAESKLDVNEREMLYLIRESGERTMRLITAMQQYFYVGEGRQQQAGKVDLDAVLRNVTSQLKELIGQHRASVNWGSLPTIWSSEALLTHVFQNLVSNAVKYRSKEAPTIHICCERRDEQWLISVEDNGIGIEPAYRECVFEPFRRLHGKQLAGSGIGLAICRTAVRRLGGSIWVEAREPHGSIFRFTLPVGHGHPPRRPDGQG